MRQIEHERAPTELPPQVARDDQEPAADQRRRQLILAVEDEPHDWQVYGKLLWYNGFDVIHARDAEEGIRLARRHSPDLILTDLMLPGMDGIDMCRRLKEESATREIPVVVLTGRTRLEFGEKARDAGCVDFLEKPIGPVEVLHTIEGLVGRPPPPVE